MRGTAAHHKSTPQPHQWWKRSLVDEVNEAEVWWREKGRPLPGAEAWVVAGGTDRGTPTGAGVGVIMTEEVLVEDIGPVGPGGGDRRDMDTPPLAFASWTFLYKTLAWAIKQPNSATSSTVSHRANISPLAQFAFSLGIKEHSLIEFSHRSNSSSLSCSRGLVVGGW